MPRWRVGCKGAVDTGGPGRVADEGGSGIKAEGSSGSCTPAKIGSRTVTRALVFKMWLQYKRRHREEGRERRDGQTPNSDPIALTSYINQTTDIRRVHARIHANCRRGCR